MYNPPLDHFRAAIASVYNQLYPNWELCIADDASPDPRVRPLLQEIAATDSRIRVAFREQNGHIAAASNTALDLATGEFIALLDQDDILPEHALYMVAEEINRHPECDVIYSDEDKIDSDGRPFEPCFKPDWNWGLIRSFNMVSHLGVYRTALVRQVGGFHEGYEGSQDHDLALRCADASRADRIRHIPHVLYHWRVIPGSTAGAAGEKSYAHQAGVRALLAHIDRIGVQAEALSGESIGLYRIRFTLPKPAPRVSVIIVESRQAAGWYDFAPDAIDYPNLEWVVCAEFHPAAFAAGKPDVRFLPGDGLDGARRKNRAAAVATGDILCFLHPDLAGTNSGWLQELVGHAMQSDVGAVGGKILTRDGLVWHGGFVVTPERPLADPFRGFPAVALGPYGLTHTIRDCDAVSGMCLAVRRDALESVGGFDSAFPSALGDVDLCLRFGQRGLRVVWSPYACVTWRSRRHISAAEDGLTHSVLARFQERWAGRLRPGRLYSPNLCHRSCAFDLAFPPPRTARDFGTGLPDVPASDADRSTSTAV